MNGTDNAEITQSVFATSPPGIPGSTDAPYSFTGSSTRTFTIVANGGESQGFLDASKVVETIEPVSSVPESVTWAMMLIGFGLVELQLRRRSVLAHT
jgi:hypothetical protein